MTTHPAAQMQAVVKVGPGDDGMALQEVPVPDVGAGMALVRVLAAGICGTDVHIARDEYGNEPPVIMGHEVFGIVESLGDNAGEQGVPGQRVALETYFSTCGQCSYCRSGHINLCPSRRSIGSYENGGFAEYIVVPVQNLHSVPASLRGIEGVLLEPLACVAQCLLDPPIVTAGDQVLVTGPGAMGQLAAQVARAAGATVTLVGLDKDHARLAVAAEIGIHTTTQATTHGHYDVVIECSGSAAAAAVALRSVRSRGRYVQVGIFGREVNVPLDLILYKEITVSSGFASTPTSWRRAMMLIESGAVTLSPLITRRIALHDWSSAFADVVAGVGIKTVMVPGPRSDSSGR